MKQLRVPEYKENESVSQFLKSLVLFLKELSNETWTDSRQTNKKISDIRYPVTSVNSKTGDVELSAADVGALASGETAENASKFNNATWAQMLKTIYPIGAIYLSASDISPASLFGGTWEQLKDRFLLAAGTRSAGTTGGAEYTMYTPSGSISGTALSIYQIPSHSHNFVVNIQHVDGDVTSGESLKSGLQVNGRRRYRDTTAAAGGAQAHNHGFTGAATQLLTMPPYLVVYMWKRVS